MQIFGHKKSVRITFARENFLRIGFEACFFLCNPATSSLPFPGLGVEYRHAISEAFALGLIVFVEFSGSYLLSNAVLSMPAKRNNDTVGIGIE